MVMGLSALKWDFALVGGMDRCFSVSTNLVYDVFQPKKTAGEASGKSSRGKSTKSARGKKTSGKEK